MKRQLVILGIVMLLAVAMPLSAGTVPQNADLDRFPIMGGPLTNAQMADMGLKPTRLAGTVDFLNYNRSRKVFELDTVNAGEVVLVDSTGVVRYRASCGNRLAVICVTEPAPQPPTYEQLPTPWIIRLAYWLEDLTMWGWLWLIVLALIFFMMLMLLPMSLAAALIAMSHDTHHRTR
jgi:hypothetical protein